MVDAVSALAALTATLAGPDELEPWSPRTARSAFAVNGDGSFTAGSGDDLLRAAERDEDIAPIGLDDPCRPRATGYHRSGSVAM